MAAFLPFAAAVTPPVAAAGPVIAGSIVSFCATYISVKFLVRWFKTNTLYPFAIYCLVVGIVSFVRFA
ncbi:MAG: hypothetical protein EBW51_09370 [Actinobacteria bacterium]|nr:hypothetical protein [Actinomycetota bacterium]